MTTRKRSTRGGSNVRQISPWLEEKILERQRTARAAVLEKNLAHTMAPADFPTQNELDALERTFERARGCSGGQSRVRQFLLSWQSAHVFGGFDVTDLWNLDEHYGGDVLTLIKMINRGPGGWYAEHYGYGKEMRWLVDHYRPGKAASEECHKCGATVRHVCDEEGHKRHLEEERRERELERLERERVERFRPYGVCKSCKIALDREPIAREPLCDICIDSPLLPGSVP